MSVKNRFRLPALAALALAFAAPQASASGDWEWVVAPYLWGAGVKTDMKSTSPPVEGSSDERFVDLIDELDGVFQVHAEGQNEHWGMFADFSYLGLAAEEDRTFVGIETDTDVRLFEAAAVWSPGEGKYDGWELFGGLRQLDTDFTVQFDPVNPIYDNTSVDLNRTYNDFMVGARYSRALSDKWSMTLRGDGSWGDTDGTWGASAMFGRKTGNGSWLFGYRILNGDFGDDDTDLSVTLSGFEVGYGFRF